MLPNQTLGLGHVELSSEQQLIACFKLAHPSEKVLEFLHIPASLFSSNRLCVGSHFDELWDSSLAPKSDASSYLSTTCFPKDSPKHVQNNKAEERESNEMKKKLD